MAHLAENMANLLFVKFAALVGNIRYTCLHKIFHTRLKNQIQFTTQNKIDANSTNSGILAC
jgi:hypothetical protein